MNRITGRRIDDEANHIRQSIGDILTTPIGSRIKRRDYGSLLPSLIDQPGNAANRLRLMSATIMALIKWEPRISVQSSLIDLDTAGKATVTLDVIRRTGPRAGAALNMSIPL